MKKSITLFLFLLCCFFNTKAQTTFLRAYGNTGIEILAGGTQAADGSFYLSGSSSSSSSVNSLHGYLIKTDQFGQLIWSRNTTGPLLERFFASAPTPDNGVVVVGSYKTTYNQALISRFDSTGNIIWTRLIDPVNFDIFTSVTATADSSFLVTGYTESYNPGGAQDVATAKIAGDGTLIWYRSLGGSLTDFGIEILEAPTINGHILAANTYSYGAGTSDAMICEITSSGGLASTTIIGTSAEEIISNMALLPNGDGVYAGRVTSGNIHQIWAFRHNPTDNVIWSKIYDFPGLNLIGNIEIANDGNLLVVASLMNSTPGQFFLLKINATTGGIIWVKEYGGTNSETLVTIGKTNNGMIYMMGYSDSYSNGSYDYFMLTAHADGSLDDCYSTDVTSSFTVLNHPLSITNVTPSNMTNVTSALFTMTMANSATTQYNICVIEEVVADFEMSADTICAGECIQLIDSSINANGWKWTISGANISTSTSQNLNNICFENAGDYTIQLTASNNTTTDSITKNIHVLPIPSLDLGADLSFCDSANYLIDATTPNVIYQWQDNSTLPTFNATSTGNYAVTITNSVGCSISDTLGLRFENTPIIALGNDTTICEHQSLMLDVTTPNANYLWNNSSTNPILWVTEADLYHVEMTLGACIISDSIQVNVIPTPFVFLGEDQFICDNETIVLDVFDPNATTYSWQDGSANSTFTIAQPGTYHAFVEYNSGCFNSDTITFLPELLIAPTLPSDTTFCKNTQLVLDAYQANILRYQWEGFSAFYGQNNLDSSSFIISKGGIYSVTVSNECRDLVQIIDVIQEDCGCYPFVPNAFTPNNDGYNDQFKIFHNCLITNYTFKIFNRWGENVFQSEDVNIGWTGTHNGKLAPSGVYVWMIEYEAIGADGQPEKRLEKGDVTLIR